MVDRITDPDAYPAELTVLEAADYLNVLVTHILTFCEAGSIGRLINTPTGPEWRIGRVELDGYIGQHAGMHTQPGTTAA